MEETIINGNGTETGHIIATTVGGRNGQPKQVTSFLWFSAFVFYKLSLNFMGLKTLMIHTAKF